MAEFARRMKPDCRNSRVCFRKRVLHWLVQSACRAKVDQLGFARSIVDTVIVSHEHQAAVSSDCETFRLVQDPALALRHCRQDIHRKALVEDRKRFGL